MLLQYVEAAPRWTYDPPCSMLSGESVTVLELGAGAGTAGLATATALADERHTVVLTDLPEVCALLERNAATSRCSTRISVRALPWGDAEAAAAVRAELCARGAGPISHILCSDLVYFPELLAPLLRTLLDLTSADPAAEVIIAYKVRSLTKEQPFWAAFGSWFDFVPVDCASEHGRVLFGSRAAHVSVHQLVEETQSADGDFFLFVATRRVSTLSDTVPEDDAQLLDGRRLRNDSGGARWDSDGVDRFECLLMGRSDDL